MQVVKPRPVQAASIPGMLGMFQNVCVSLLGNLRFAVSISFTSGCANMTVLKKLVLNYTTWPFNLALIFFLMLGMGCLGVICFCIRATITYNKARA